MYLQLIHMSCLLPHCKPSTMEPTTDEPTDMEPTLSPSFGPTLRDDPETSPEPSKAPISPSEKSPTVAPSEGPTTTSAPSPPRNDNPGQSRPTPKPTYIIVIPPSPPSTAPPPKVSPGENTSPPPTWILIGTGPPRPAGELPIPPSPTPKPTYIIKPQVVYPIFWGKSAKATHYIEPKAYSEYFC